MACNTLKIVHLSVVIVTDEVVFGAILSTCVVYTKIILIIFTFTSVNNIIVGHYYLLVYGP